MKKTISPKQLKQRKFLVVAPLLVLPFITMAFWALGGGKGVENDMDFSRLKTGFNFELPNAKFKEGKAIDKLGYYEKAEADSMKFHEQVKNDPYRRDELKKDFLNKDTSLSPDLLTNKASYPDHNEIKVYKKLDELNAALNEASSGDQLHRKMLKGQSDLNINRSRTANTDQLEQMMAAMNNNPADTSIQQLNDVLDKVLDLQYPDRVRKRVQEKSRQNKDEVFPVTLSASTTTVSLLDTPSKQKNTNAFWSIDPAVTSDDIESIEAVVHEKQTLVNGAVVKLRLTNDIFISGHLVHKDSFIYGTGVLNKERLEVYVSSIRDGDLLFPVKLDVYDIDGIKGIYIPGAISRDVAKQSSDNALQSFALQTLDPSLGAQAASAGIETAKSLLSKKIKLIRVQVKAGYRVLLKDTNTGK